MRAIVTCLAIALGATSASAQGLLDAICDDALRHGETATDAEYRSDPLAHADDFCALARFEPYKAARQLSKVAGLNRRFNNRNRHYFDPRRGDPQGLYIQLLRPWMRDANASGAAEWTVTHSRESYRWALHDIWIHNAHSSVNCPTAPFERLLWHVRVVITHFARSGGGIVNRGNRVGYHYSVYSGGDDVLSANYLLVENDQRGGGSPVSAHEVKAVVERTLDDQGSFPPCSITH